MTATTVNTPMSIRAGRKASRWASKPVWSHIGLFASVAAGTAFANRHHTASPRLLECLVGTPYGNALASIEAQVSKIAAGQNAVLVGSFDPAKAGCQESSFRDYIHLDEACLHKVFGKIPRV
jgi:hypothetical protein